MCRASPTGIFPRALELYLDVLVVDGPAASLEALDSDDEAQYILDHFGVCLSIYSER